MSDSVGPYGLNTVPPRSEAFFLVRGELNATFAHGYAQPAVGIEVWRPEYLKLPAFMHVKRIWVVVNDTEDNLSFVTSIAEDKFIRRQCLVSTWGVQVVAKSKMLWEREQSYPILSDEFRRYYDKRFEVVWEFHTFPTAREHSKIEKLGTARPKDICPAPRMDWWWYRNSWY